MAALYKVSTLLEILAHNELVNICAQYYKRVSTLLEILVHLDRHGNIPKRVFRFQPSLRFWNTWERDHHTLFGRCLFQPSLRFWGCLYIHLIISGSSIDAFQPSLRFYAA